MQRQIQRQKTKLKNKENSRISKLVERAYKLDPRVAAFKAAEKARKDEERHAKLEAKRKQEEEAARKVREAEEARQAEKARQEEEVKFALEYVAAPRTSELLGVDCCKEESP